MSKSSFLSKIAIFSLGIFLLILTWGWLSPPAALSQSSQVNSLRSDIYQIEARLNRIELQLNQIRTPPPSGAVPPPDKPTANPREERNRRPLPPETREQMFDRLATLAIELRDRIIKLETRVSQLESRK